MASWAEFAERAPTMAAAGRGLIYRTEIGRTDDIGRALLATVRGAELPRIHPITVAVAADRLVAFIIVDSPKANDLGQDGRYALHAHQDPTVPHEFVVRGRAMAIEEGPIRQAIAATWSFEVDDTYRLFEFLIEHAVYGERASPRDWPPRYTAWRDPNR